MNFKKKKKKNPDCDHIIMNSFFLIQKNRKLFEVFSFNGKIQIFLLFLGGEKRIQFFCYTTKLNPKKPQLWSLQ
jgi:hypothetical protein